MSRQRSLAPLLLLFLAYGVAEPRLQAQEKGWQEWLAEAEGLAESGDRAGVELALQEARRAVEATESHTVTRVLVRVRLGEFYRRQQRPDEASQVLGEAVSIAGSDQGYPVEDLVRLYKALGLAYLEGSHGRKAQKQFEAALETQEKKLGKNHLDLVDALVGLGLAQQQQREYMKAELSYLRAVRILAGDDPEADLSQERAFQALARMIEAEFLRYGEIDTEKIWWQRVSLLDRLARLHAEFGGGTAGILYAETAVKSRRTRLGPRSPGVARGLGNLASVLRRAGELKRARECLLEALKITRSHPRLRGISSAWILKELSEVAAAADDGSGAGKWARDALSAVASAYDTRHPYYVDAVREAMERMEKYRIEEHRREFARQHDECKRDVRPHHIVLPETPGLEPPLPIKRVRAGFSDEASRLKYAEKVVLLVDIDSDGKVSNVNVFKSAGHGLDDEAVYALRKWRFSPARLHGKPVAVTGTVELNFRTRIR